MNRNVGFGIMTLAAVAASMLTVACGGRTSGKLQGADWADADTVVIDMDNTPCIMREEAFDSVWFVKLESSGDSFIGNADMVIFGDSTIIVGDQRIAKAVFMFDYQGNYIGRMSNTGNGPDEYLSIEGLAKLPDGSVAIFDPVRQRIGIFEERGKNIAYIDLPMFASSVQFIDNETMAFDTYGLKSDVTKSDGGYASFLTMNLRGKAGYLFGNTDFGPDFFITRERNLYSFDGKVYCNVNFEDAIYELGRDGAKGRYRLVMKPDCVADYLPVRTDAEFLELCHRYNFFNGNFVELNGCSYFNVISNTPISTDIHLLYDHKTKQPYILQNRFDDPIMAFFTIPVNSFNGNCLVTCHAASQILSAVSYMEMETDDCRIRELVDGMRRDDNPVLFFFRVAM